MVLIEGGRFELGESAPEAQHEGLVVPKHRVTLESFCVATHPFPGEGRRWPSDGMSLSQVGRWEARIQAEGRRACTVDELIRVSAGEANASRTVEAGDCESDDDEPKPIGSHPKCVSDEGVYDLGVRSSWADLDDLDGDYERYERWVSWGHTWRADTFYPPTNFAIHSHDPAEASYIDDGWRSCANPHGDKGRWAGFSEAFPGSFAAFLQ